MGIIRKKLYRLWTIVLVSTCTLSSLVLPLRAQDFSESRLRDYTEVKANFHFYVNPRESLLSISPEGSMPFRYLDSDEVSIKSTTKTCITNYWFLWFKHREEIEQKVISVKRENGLENGNVLNTHFLDQALDWESLLDLNRESYKLWNDIKDKLEVSDAELTDLYFSNNIRSREINQKIKLFKKQVKAFLFSTTFQLTYGLSYIENFHPLFSQVIVENYLKHAYVDRVDWTSPPKVDIFLSVG